jgi:hypothetical protein
VDQICPYLDENNLNFVKHVSISSKQATADRGVSRLAEPPPPPIRNKYSRGAADTRKKFLNFEPLPPIKSSA